MDANFLVDTTVTPPLPAPVWFIQFFKVLGFSLHEVPMNLWYAGIITAMVLLVWGSEQGKRFSSRLMLQMPIIIAIGINFGIVPLLFIQVGYAKLFYPATVLMAWFWFMVIVILIPAYYGVYIYAFGLRDKGRRMPRWKQAAGWTAAAMFLVIGFFFANAMSLMENWRSWDTLWQRTSFSGAALGTALNVVDPRFWPRWLLMFGLALMTTGMWVAFDAAWFAGRESSDYRQWAKGFAWRLYTLGAVWFAVAGAGYSFGTWSQDVRNMMFWSWPAVLTVLTAAAPAGPWYLLWRARRQPVELDRRWASLVALAHFGVLAINAISRQVVQNIEVAEYYRIGEQATSTQWSAMAVFLLSFVVGVGIVVWLIWQVAKLPAEPDRA